VQELPAELKPWIYTETDAEAFDIDEFLVRAAKREETDVETALRHARAVFFALGDALSPRGDGAPFETYREARPALAEEVYRMQHRQPQEQELMKALHGDDPSAPTWEQSPAPAGS